MKTTLCLPIVAVLVFAHANVGSGAVDPSVDRARTNEPAMYPWSDASAYVRLPRSFLPELGLSSMTVRNRDAMEYVMTDEFVQLCGVTPSERAKVTAAVTHALHVYFTARAEHWRPSDEKYDADDWGEVVLERFDFTQETVPEEREAVCEALRQQVRATLGAERAQWFWTLGESLISKHPDRTYRGGPGVQRDGGLNGGFGFYAGLNAEPVLDPSQRPKVIHAFMLRRNGPGLLIDYQVGPMITVGPRRVAGGGGGGPFPRAWDIYAPAAMKPILARWRQQVADASARPAQASASGQGTGGRQPAPPNGPGGTYAAPPALANGAKWVEGAAYVEAPKTLIPSLGIRGLSLDGQVADEAAIVFGLTPAERQQADALYQEMKTRFEALERAHVKRASASELRFMIEAFPEEAKSMRQEWARGLARLVGPQRGAGLAELCQSPLGVRVSLRDDPRGVVAKLRGEPGWLRRGVETTWLSVRLKPSQGGPPAIQHLDWRTEGGRTGRYDAGADLPPWRHLLTPELLQP